MIQGLYAAANGMMAVEDRQAVIANNIANSMTPGFKRQIAVQEGFYQVYYGELKDTIRFDGDVAPGGGMKLIETYSVFDDGIVATTGNPFDIALLGPGFIALDFPDDAESTQGGLFTRNGKFAVGGNGQLVTSNGYTVQSEDGDELIVNGGLVAIDQEGAVTVDGALIGRIRLVEFDNAHMLNRAGYAIYHASAEVLDQSNPAVRTLVAPEALETSNVQVPTEIAHMMIALRAYAANQRVIASIDQTASRLIEQVGVPS